MGHVRLVKSSFAVKIYINIHIHMYIIFCFTKQVLCLDLTVESLNVISWTPWEASPVPTSFPQERGHGGGGCLELAAVCSTVLQLPSCACFLMLCLEDEEREGLLCPGDRVGGQAQV